MVTWTKPRVVGLAVVAFGLVVSAWAVAWEASRPTDVVDIHFQVDLLATPVKPEWGMWGPDPVLKLLAHDESSGVLADPPADPTFRGVILTGPDLPGGGAIDDFRVMRDGYYIEFADGRVRYVDDPAPWLAIRVDVKESVGLSLWYLLEDAGVV